jgi:hypothetical protein
MPPNTLSTTALTSLERVKEWLGTPDLDSSQDSRLTWLINAASGAVAQYAARQFSSGGTATHTFQVQGAWPNNIIDLAPYDAATITSVTLIDIFGNQAVLPSQYYQARPVHQPSGVYTRVKFYWAPVLPYAQSAQVVGTWGFPSVPPDVEDAVIIVAAKWFQRDQNVATPEYAYPPSTPGDDLSLPYDARMLLLPYRRAVI